MRTPWPLATTIALALVPVATVEPAATDSPPKSTLRGMRRGLVLEVSGVAPVAFTVAGGWR